MYGDETAFFAIMGAMGFVMFVVVAVFYVLKSLGISALAANRGLENPWLGWIPIADLYLLGMLVGSMDLFGYKLEKLEIVVPAVMVGGSLLGMIPIIGWLLMIALMVFSVMFIYKLYEMYTTSAVMYTVLSVVLGLFPIFIFIIRNNPPLVQGQQPGNNGYYY